MVKKSFYHFMIYALKEGKYHVSKDTPNVTTYLTFVFTDWIQIR